MYILFQIDKLPKNCVKRIFANYSRLEKQVIVSIIGAMHYALTAFLYIFIPFYPFKAGQKRLIMKVEKRPSKKINRKLKHKQESSSC